MSSRISRRRCALRRERGDLDIPRRRHALHHLDETAGGLLWRRWSRISRIGRYASAPASRSEHLPRAIDRTVRPALDLGQHLLHEARLADARLAHDPGHHPAPAATPGRSDASRARSRSRPDHVAEDGRRGRRPRHSRPTAAVSSASISSVVGRADASLASIASTSASSAGGTSGLRREGGAGCSLRIACSTENRGSRPRMDGGPSASRRTRSRVRTRRWRCRSGARWPARVTCTPACR